MSLGRYFFLQIPIMRNRKIPVITGVAIFFILIIDLLMTRHILPYTKDMEILMFILTVVIGYGIGSWILLGYTTQISKDIRTKSRFINLMHWSMVIIQFSLFLVLLLMIISRGSTRKVATRSNDRIIFLI